MTIKEALRFFSNKLEANKIENPMVNTEWILCDILKINRSSLFLPDFAERNPLTSSQIEKISDYIGRRIQHEPLQYILGTAVFYGYDIFTQAGILIPRPETEIMTEFTISYLLKNKPNANIMDYCTGSGCISIALAAQCPQTQILAIDISDDALKVARKNIDFHSLNKQITLQKGDCLQSGHTRIPFDLIISNPPYIPSDDIKELSPEVSLYEPHLALDGGKDGLQFYRHLAETAPQILDKNGVLIAEFGDDQFYAIADLFRNANWSEITPYKDFSGKYRFFIAKFSEK